MAIQSAREFRDRLAVLCRQSRWNDAEDAITARDDAIRAEEREACAAWVEQSPLVGMSGGTVFTRELAKAIRARAQPVPACHACGGSGSVSTDMVDRNGERVEVACPICRPVKHGEGGADRAGDEVMQSREAMLRKLDAERAKETGDE